MGNSAQLLPPKMAIQFAEMAARGEGVRIGTSDIWEFPQGTSNVVCLIGLGNPTGHVRRDAARAAQLHAALSKAEPSP